MEQRFKRLVFTACLLIFSGLWVLPVGAKETAPEEVHDPETLALLANRFQALSSSLNEMPDLPKLDETIELPMNEVEPAQPEEPLKKES